jgi:ribosome biogenesis protein Tsr3
MNMNALDSNRGTVGESEIIIFFSISGFNRTLSSKNNKKIVEVGLAVQSTFWSRRARVLRFGLRSLRVLPMLFQPNVFL